MKASIVIDLGFGDSGKGITVDYLAKQQPQESLVIRFSGGHQVGHTVKTNNFLHTFSNFGAGSLRGVPTYYTPETTIFPPAIIEEYKVLEPYRPILIFHPLVKVTTPYDVAYNIARETYLNHGSCGVGFGATIQRSESGVNLYAKDLSYSWILNNKLKSIKEYYIHKTRGESPEITILFKEELEKINDSLFVKSCEECLNLYEIKMPDTALNYKHLIFEGSQGILLDQDHGIFPHVTPSNTSSKLAFDFLREITNTNTGHVSIYYVTRCYQTRHGNGPMSSEIPIKLINSNQEANVANQFQGEFRIAQLDVQLINYALETDKIYHKENNIQKNLVITCLDQFPDFDIQGFLSKTNTKFNDVFGSYSPDSTNFKSLKLNPLQ